MVEIKYVDGTEESIEAMVDPEMNAAFCYDRASNSFIIFTSDDLRDDVFVSRDMVKKIQYIHV